MARTRITHEVDNAVIDKNTQGRPEIAIFAKTLNHLLVEKGVHQNDLAQALGISSGSISSYRNGTKEPRLSMIVKIADYFGVDCHYLMTGIQAENATSAADLGLSEAAIQQLKAFCQMPLFNSTLNEFISSDCFRQIIAYLFNFHERMVDIVTLSEALPVEEVKIQNQFSSGDLMEYRASKNLAALFDSIQETELSKSNTLVKTVDGYKLVYKK